MAASEAIPEAQALRFRRSRLNRRLARRQAVHRQPSVHSAEGQTVRSLSFVRRRIFPSQAVKAAEQDERQIGDGPDQAGVVVGRGVDRVVRGGVRGGAAGGAGLGQVGPPGCVKVLPYSSLAGHAVAAFLRNRQ